MRAVRINFIQPVSTFKRVLRLVILASGVLLVIYSLVQQKHIGAEKTALQWQIGHFVKSDVTQTELARAPNNLNKEYEAIKHMSEVVHQLNIPWNKLFTTLEQATSKDIYVMTVSPNVAQRSLNLQASATDIKATIDFTQRLSVNGTLSQIHLIQEEPDQENTQFPLNFLIAATWNIAP